MFLAVTGFTQHLNPLNSILGSTLVALLPLALLLVLLAVMRVTAWLAVIIGAVVTIIMAITIWDSPAVPTFQAWGVGAATGIWSIDWIVFWGVVIYNVRVETGAFAHFRHWLVTQATADVRVQAILMAWALGALLEGLVGFGHPWAVIAPILVGLGVTEIDAIRVAAIGNNAQSPTAPWAPRSSPWPPSPTCRCSTCPPRWAGSWRSSPFSPRGS